MLTQKQKAEFDGVLVGSYHCLDNLYSVAVHLKLGYDLLDFLKTLLLNLKRKILFGFLSHFPWDSIHYLPAHYPVNW